MDAIAHLIAQSDVLHPPLLQAGGAGWYKEWHHFCAITPEVQVILNLNLSGDSRPAAKPGGRQARAVVLVQDGAWHGDVDHIPDRDVSVAAGRVDLHLGHNRIDYRQGGFEVSAALQNRPVSLMLRFTPVTWPLMLLSDTPIGAGRINWIVVPRLQATGTVIVGKKVYRLEGAPAYHDHNWGRWLWGHDFAWEWGYALPDSPAVPWTLVFDRTTDRRRTQSLELTLALWKGERVFRIFTQREVSVRPSGFLRMERVPKIPGVMRLVSPVNTADIPQRLEISARQNGDWLQGQFEAADAAQIVIPNETDLGVTTINEVSGRLSLAGEVRGERVALEGRGIFEFLT
jgi:hypothetical protein